MFIAIPILSSGERASLGRKRFSAKEPPGINSEMMITVSGLMTITPSMGTEKGTEGSKNVYERNDSEKKSGSHLNFCREKGYGLSRNSSDLFNGKFLV